MICVSYLTRYILWKVIVAISTISKVTMYAATVLIVSAIYVTLIAQGTVATDTVIISRAQWNAKQPKSQFIDLTQKPAPYVILHHSATAGCDTQAECQLKLKGFQNYHMNQRGWSDIGYNFVIGEDGNIYEGRGWDKQGAHSKNFNNKSIGICIIGNYTNRTPNEAAIQAVERLIADGVANNKIKEDYKLLGHRQTWRTACPGNSLYSMMQSWPHWVPAA